MVAGAERKESGEISRITERAVEQRSRQAREKEGDDMKAETMLIEPELKLPEPPPPRGNYMGAVQHDSLLFISGQFPLINGQLVYRGKLGRDLDVAEGYQAARLCAINALAQAQKILLSLDVVAGIARLEGYLQTATGFQEHAQVL
ncbi:MAG: RidA family protein, partial [Chloroflexota bacterium]